MEKLKDLLLYKLSLIIIGTSAMNVSINMYYIGQAIASKFKKHQEIDSLSKELFKEKPMIEPKLSQMQKIEKNIRIDVAIVKDKAYWVQDNVLYQTNVHSSGEILADEAKPVDVINMPEKQLKHIIEIVDSFNK